MIFGSALIDAIAFVVICLAAAFILVPFGQRISYRRDCRKYGKEASRRDMEKDEVNRMADMMTFPNTVEEFMEEYKIVDTEEIYTNGTELVPIFRMMQWFEHVSATDTISRQDAIVAAKHAWAKGLEPSQYIEIVPAARPEIIRCKDCKYYKAYEYTGELACHYVIGGTVIRNLNDYCSRAERREE